MKNLSLILIGSLIMGGCGDTTTDCCDNSVVSISAPIEILTNNAINDIIENNTSEPIKVENYMFDIKILTRCHNIIDVGTLYITIKPEHIINVTMDSLELNFNMIESYLHDISDYDESDNLIVNNITINSNELLDFITETINHD